MDIIQKNIDHLYNAQSIKMHHIMPATKMRNTVFLTDSERNYLGGWEAEKYRQKL